VSPRGPLAARSAGHRWFTPVGWALAQLAATGLLIAAAGSASAYDFNWGPSLGTISSDSGSYSLNALGFTAPVEDQGQWGTAGISRRSPLWSRNT
jgi:hypothetical protein